MQEISYNELAALDGDEFTLVDIRDENSFEYGHIPGALNIPESKIFNAHFPAEKKLVLYCRSGAFSAETAERLCEKGINAFSLKGGYVEWLRNRISLSDGDVATRTEESIRKKFYNVLMHMFTKAIVTYDLVKPGDKIAVCISGGKDSMLMAKLFQELKRHNKFEFELVFLVMDPGYSPENREMIELNAAMLNIPITVFESDIFKNVFNIEKSPCYICARMRRGYLYSNAKELGCNKIALGHHYDDVIETILMGMLYGGQVQTMMPRLKSTNFEGMELIRPMYLIREADIKAWRDFNGLRFIQCACRFTETCALESGASSNTGSKRKKVKELISRLAQDDPMIEQNIFKSVENVNLATVIAYKDFEGVKHYFWEK